MGRSSISVGGLGSANEGFKTWARTPAPGQVPKNSAGPGATRFQKIVELALGYGRQMHAVEQVEKRWVVVEGAKGPDVFDCQHRFIMLGEGGI